MRLLRIRPARTIRLAMNFTSTSSGSPPPSAPPDQTRSTSVAPSHRIFAPTSTGTIQAAQYTLSSLSRESLSSDPLAQFHAWFDSASNSGVYQPETVCLSTCELPSGVVSSRFFYLKTLDETGFVVYSNTGTSHKMSDLRSNPRASLAFWWREVERQVRVEGRVELLPAEESQQYFDTRARGSRIGAWASRQSQVIADRGELDGWVAEVEEKFNGQEQIPVPDYWGGIRVVPDTIEFWQGRQSRLHDRFRYSKGKDVWKIDRLSP